MPTIVVGEPGFPKIQDAIDEMASLSLTPQNRGTVVIPPGRYEERVTDNVSHLDVVAQISGTAIIEYMDDDSGGTYRIGREADPDPFAIEVRDKVLVGLRILRNDRGVLPGAGHPESALDVGVPENDDGLCDGVIVRNCIIEGVHDAMQVGGNFPTGVPGLVTLENCILRCVHDALAVFGDVRLMSKNNLFHVDTRGIAPYLTDIADWKSTGFHLNCWSRQNPHSYFLSSHDTMYLIGGENVGVVGNTPGQAQMAGYLFYDLKFATTPPPLDINRVEIVEPDIHLEWNEDATPANPIAGISVWSNKVKIPPGYFTVQGGSITVRQTSTGSSAPHVVSGVRVDTEGASDEIDNIVRVFGTNIRVENLKSGGQAYSLHTVGEHDHIEADVYSDEPISGPSGTITPANHKP